MPDECGAHGIDVFLLWAEDEVSVGGGTERGSFLQRHRASSINADVGRTEQRLAGWGVGSRGSGARMQTLDREAGAQMRQCAGAGGTGDSH